MNKLIDGFEIPVSDVPRAQAFYEAVLQTTLQRESHAGPDMQMAVFAGGQLLMGEVALPQGLGFMAHMRDVDGKRVGLHTYA